MVRSGCFVLQVVAQPLKWLLLLATTMGMCLMNGYSVVKDPQTRLPYVRKEGREFSASLPSSSLGIILDTTTVTFSEGESVFDVLQRTCRERGIHMESSWTPIYNSAYVEGIANLYEFDVGSQSGWMYKVNGWFPNYGCSRYALQQGDEICWMYTCVGLGEDIGGGYAAGG